MFGYHGRAMLVDLTTQSVRWEALPEEVLRRFIGGTGLGAYLLGFGLRRYMVASVVGVLIAATAVTVVVLTGATAFEVFLKH